MTATDADVQQPDDAHRSAAAESMRPSLRAVGLRRSFHGEIVLDGVDLTVQAPQSVAILGPSGSGKSTLLHILACLLPPSDGEVWFGDHRIDNLPDSQRSRLRLESFGFVFQFGELVPELTVVENVELPLRLAGHRRAHARSRAREVLELLELDRHGHKHLWEVSGGQAQRVAVARAVVHRPAIVFADEPTGSLDADNSDVVMDLLLHTIDQVEASLVIATHDRRVAGRLTRRVHLVNHQALEDLGA